MLIFAASLSCASNGGIGVGYDAQNVVQMVLKNSPAQRADIHVGDQLLAPIPKPGRIGTMCLVRYMRDKTYFELRLKRVNLDKLREWR